VPSYSPWQLLDEAEVNRQKSFNACGLRESRIATRGVQSSQPRPIAVEAVDSARDPSLVLPLLSVWHESFNYVVTFLRTFAPPLFVNCKLGWDKSAQKTRNEVVIFSGRPLTSASDHNMIPRIQSDFSTSD
jgi:hypothetical protein